MASLVDAEAEAAVVAPPAAEGLAATPASASEIKMLTYNCGLLRFRLFGTWGGTVFHNPPHVTDRFPHLAKALLDSGADIIALQEIYEPGHIDQLCAAVKEVYPYSGYRRSGGWAKFTNGLMFLSKFEISDVALEMHAQMAGVERMLGSKAVLAVRVNTPVGQLYLMNLHTTAGGGLSPEAVDAVRESELQEAVDMGTAALGEGYIPIILGDMNMGPVVSKPNYDFVISQSYFDAVTQCVSEEQLPLMTWDPANPLNAVGPHKDCPPQWVDHFFVHDSSGLEGAETAIVLTEPFVELPAKKKATEKVTLSDHYGVSLTLRKVGS
mmetsp:Transcript_64085/g.177085  ORF Transcript_64085/g.177085 Transcript_64085/m.177085 type:complete len:324 (+) Transcript_64085:260-1231(+)